MPLEYFYYLHAIAVADQDKVFISRCCRRFVKREKLPYEKVKWEKTSVSVLTSFRFMETSCNIVAASNTLRKYTDGCYRSNLKIPPDGAPKVSTHGTDAQNDREFVCRLTVSRKYVLRG